MTGEIEAAGDAITGGLIAGAVEGGVAGHGAHDGTCLNCGTRLIGAHCHACGQSAHIHRSLGAIWHDIAHGVLHFEGKIWRTLPLLAFHPGELTRRYIHGERVHFVSPLALFLFSIFMMFAVLSTLGNKLEMPGDKTEVSVKTQAGIKKGRAEVAAELARVEEQRKAIKAAGGDAEAINEEREALKSALSIMDAAAEGRTPVGDMRLGFKTGWQRLDKGIAKANENPNLLLYKLQTNAYKFSWILIPISVPFVWLLFFWHRKRHVYDHAVFVTYSLGFMTLFFTALTLLGTVGMGTTWLTWAAIIVPPVHIFFQLKGAYEQTTAKALIRTFVLLNFALVALVLFALLLLSLGLIG